MTMTPREEYALTPMLIATLTTEEYYRELIAHTIMADCGCFARAKEYIGEDIICMHGNLLTPWPEDTQENPLGIPRWITWTGDRKEDDVQEP